MNREELRQELLLYAGQSELPVELLQALDEDAEMRAWFDEMQGISAQMGSDDDFVPDFLSADIFAARVDAAIQRQEKRSPRFFGLQRVLSYAAAVLLGVTSFYVADRWTEGQSQLQSFVDSDDPIEQLIYGELEMVDDGMVDILIEDYGRDVYFDAGERLLDDLTEEELKYLEEYN